MVAEGANLAAERSSLLLPLWRQWFPACAGMTARGAGMTARGVGTTAKGRGDDGYGARG